MGIGIWRFITDFGDTAVTVPLALLMAGFLVAAREPRLALGWAAAVLGCAGAVGALKLAFSVCGDPWVGPSLTSPSGHTAMSILVYGGFATVISAGATWWVRAALIGGAALLAIAIALSRAILHAHSPLEVEIGLAVGLTALALLVAIVARWRRRQRGGPAEQLPVGSLAIAALVVALLFHGERWPAEQIVRRLALWFDALRPWCG